MSTNALFSVVSTSYYILYAVILLSVKQAPQWPHGGIFGGIIYIAHCEVGLYQGFDGVVR